MSETYYTREARWFRRASLVSLFQCYFSSVAKAGRKIMSERESAHSSMWSATSIPHFFYLHSSALSMYNLAPGQLCYWAHAVLEGPKGICLATTRLECWIRQASALLWHGSFNVLRVVYSYQLQVLYRLCSFTAQAFSRAFPKQWASRDIHNFRCAARSHYPDICRTSSCSFPGQTCWSYIANQTQKWEHS